MKDTAIKKGAIRLHNSNEQWHSHTAQFLGHVPAFPFVLGKTT